MSTQYQFLIKLTDYGDSMVCDRYVGFNSRKQAIQQFNYYKNRPTAGITQTKLFQGCFNVYDMYAIQRSNQMKLIMEDCYFAPVEDNDEDMEDED